MALKVEIDNWRWAGVPFYLRTGKKLGSGERIISIAFREPPKSMFPDDSGVGASGPDHLTFDLADSSKLSLSFYGKKPGPGMTLEKLSLQFALHETGQDADVLEAYERLIHDAMIGDHTLFNTAEGIERLWEVSTPLLENPEPGAALPPGGLGPARHQRAHRTAHMAAALRAPLAGEPRHLTQGRRPVQRCRLGARGPRSSGIRRRGAGRPAPRQQPVTWGGARWPRRRCGRAALQFSACPLECGTWGTVRPARSTESMGRISMRGGTGGRARSSSTVVAVRTSQGARRGSENKPSGGEAPKAKQSRTTPPMTTVGTTSTEQQMPLRRSERPTPMGWTSESRTTRNPRIR